MLELVCNPRYFEGVRHCDFLIQDFLDQLRSTGLKLGQTVLEYWHGTVFQSVQVVG